MIRPRSWMNPEGTDGNHIGCGILKEFPSHTEFEQSSGKKPDCHKFWYSNNVRIPGQPTLPEEVSQPEVECIGQAGHHDGDHEFPWWSPGTAPIFGSCGTAGGIPAGCHGDYSGHFGDCCTEHCDAYALGLNAEQYEWPNVFVTEWPAGSYQEVQWYVGANHAGGYSWRLCKMPQSGLEDLTEECFQENQLDFVGEEQWVIYHNQGHWDYPREEVKAKRTTEGTFPPGSMWTANPILPSMEEGGVDGRGHGHIIDVVRIPNDLERGDYVLSFRWDWTVNSEFRILKP